MFSESGSGRAQAIAGATVVVLVALALTAVWSVDYLPTHDGPQHIYTIHAANHLADPALGYSSHLEQGRAVTSYGFFAFFAPLDLILDWKDATRGALGAMVLLWIGGCIVLARALHRERIWLGIALAGAGFQWSLYMGLFSFYAATALGLWILALAISRREWTARERLPLAVLLIIQATMHVFPAVLTAGCIGIVALARSPIERWPREIGLGLAMTAPVLGLLAGLIAVSSEQVGYHDRAGQGFVTSWPPLWTLGKCFVGGPSWRAWTLLLCALAAPIFVLRKRASREDSIDRWLVAAGAAALLCAVVLPLHIPVWDLFSVRFLPVAMTLMILAIPFEAIRSPALRHGAAAALSLFALASTGWAIVYNNDLDQRGRAALAGLEAGVESNGTRIAIVMDPFLGRPLQNADAFFPFVVPMLNIGQLYATEQGGVPADTFAISPPTHHVLFRRDGPSFPSYPSRSYPIALAAPENQQDAELREKIITYVASYASEFDDVILWGEPGDAEMLIARGFQSVWRDDNVMLARFEGCPLAVEFSGEDGATRLPPGSMVEMGWYPLLEVAKRLIVSPDSAPPESVEIGNAPCGPVWLRVRALAESDADPSGPLRGCRGADPAGRITLADTRRDRVLRCQLVDLADPDDALHTASHAAPVR